MGQIDSPIVVQRCIDAITDMTRTTRDVFALLSEVVPEQDDQMGVLLERHDDLLTRVVEMETTDELNACHAELLRLRDEVQAFVRTHHSAALGEEDDA